MFKKISINFSLSALTFVLATGCLNRISVNGLLAARTNHKPTSNTTSNVFSGVIKSFSSSPILFSNPKGLAVDSFNNVYVADTGNNTIRKITPAGDVITLAGTAGVQGNIDDTGTAAQFKNPTGVTVDNFGNVYVADMGNNAIRKITPLGVVTTLAGTYNNPTQLTIDSTGILYVTNSGDFLSIGFP